MFRPRRRYGGYGRGSGMGLFLLGLQLMNLFSFISRSNEYFPVTLGVLALNIAAYLQPGAIAWPSLQQGCISVQGVWFQKQWKRVLFSPFLHSSDFHLYYNMASFIWKAISLERHFGTLYFLYMISVFSVGTGAVYLGINYMLAELLDQWSYIQSCAVGFSAVLFALKVITTHMQPRGVTRVMGVIPVPMRLACWVELVLISVLFPHVSFVGHLAGILVGLAYVSGPLKILMDIPLSLVSGVGPQGGGFGRRSYTYRAAQSGYRGPERQADVDRENSEEGELPAATRRNERRSYTYRAAQSGYRSQGRQADVDRENSEERELQATIRRSLDDDTNSHTRTIHSEEDEDVQAAIERSLADSNSSSPSEHIPPYNPHFPSAPPEPSDTPTNQSQSTSSVRRRPVDSVGTSNGLDVVRAARLRRFGTNS